MADSSFDDRVPDQGPPTESEQATLLVHDDLVRSRLTAFFRPLLVLPHLVLLAAWSVLALFVAVVDWVATLITGRPVGSRLQARYVRYGVHVASYLSLAADPFPAFGGGGRDRYPVDVELPESGLQERWKTALRLPLAVPALLLVGALASFGVIAAIDGGTGQDESAGLALGVIATTAVLGWFASLARGRMPQGLRDLAAYAIGYLAQAGSYLLFLTDRYPNSDPLHPYYPQRAPEHPVRIEVADYLQRSRLTVLFRLLLSVPHLIWLGLWSVAMVFVVIANWFVTLVNGRPAESLHRLTARYVRYYTQVIAFSYVLANPFPGFTGEEGAYPIDLKLPEPHHQDRRKTLLRGVLVLPAAIVAEALTSVLTLVAVFCWFPGVAMGRVPRGLRNLGAFSLRYSAQTLAYLLLLTDRYPYAGPSLEQLPAGGHDEEPSPPIAAVARQGSGPGRRELVAFGALALLVLGAAGGWAISEALSDDDGSAASSSPAPPIVIESEPDPEEPAELGFPEFATVNTTRIGGPDSVSIAAGTALAAIPASAAVEGPPAVALVESSDWASALAAASLYAPPVGIPTLLSGGDEVPELTAQAIEALDPEGTEGKRGIQAYRIGEVASPEGLESIELRGSGPIELANQIDRFRARLGEPEAEHLLFVSLDDPELAMPAAAWAALTGDPIFFLSGDEIPPATLEAVERHEKTPGYVLAPPSAVPQKVVNALSERLPSVKRVGDADPVQNAIAFARYADGTFGWDINFPGHGFVIANSARPTDAGAAAPLSGIGKPGPLLLTDSPETLPDALKGFLLDNKPGYQDDPTAAVYNHTWILGDESTISVDFQAEVDELTELTQVGPGPGLGDGLGPEPGTPEDEPPR